MRFNQDYFNLMVKGTMIPRSSGDVAFQFMRRSFVDRAKGLPRRVAVRSSISCISNSTLKAVLAEAAS